MTLSGVYGFWKYVSNLDRRETRRYLEMLYALKYRKMVRAIPLRSTTLTILPQFMTGDLISLCLCCVQATTVPLAIEGETAGK